MKASLLFLILCLQFFKLDIQAQITENLKFTMISRREVEGCWKDHTETVFSMCFHISERLMRIMRSQKGSILALYHTNKDKDVQYLQVLGDGLLRYKSVEIRVPMLVSRSVARKVIKRKVKQLSFKSESPRDLHLFVKEILQSNRYGAFLKTTGRRFLTENEVASLGELSATLSRHSMSSLLSKTMKRFNLFCLGLIRSVGPPTSNDHFPGRDSRHRIISEVAVLSQVCASEKSDRHLQGTGHDNNIAANENPKSPDCRDMRNGTDQECFGMCGKTCWCWNWVCGDCCLHKGCLQHDACCRYANPQYLSTYCLLPFLYGFDCNHGYNGYPECLHS